MLESTPLDVKNKTFAKARHGYAIVEVDAFLDQVAEELARLEKANGGPHEQSNGRTDEQAIARDLVTAQRVAEQTITDAQTEAKAIIAGAHTTAAETTETAQLQAARAWRRSSCTPARSRSSLGSGDASWNDRSRPYRHSRATTATLRGCVQELMNTLNSSVPTGTVVADRGSSPGSITESPQVIAWVGGANPTWSWVG
jgi:cell division initiation protein